MKFVNKRQQWERKCFMCLIDLSLEAQPKKTNRTMYDASLKPAQNVASLNACLETGPPIQNSKIQCGIF